MSDSKLTFATTVAIAILAGAILDDSYASTPTSLPSFDRVRIITTPRAIPEAELIDQNGDDYNFSDLRGKVSLVFFGFTHCANVCPAAMSRLRELWRSKSIDPANINYVLVSVDGERDTPERMSEFLSAYSTDFIGLTGDPSRVQQVAQQFASAFFKGSVQPDGRYDVRHSPQVFVVDAKGQIRAEFYSASLDAMTGTVNALLSE